MFFTAMRISFNYASLNNGDNSHSVNKFIEGIKKQTNKNYASPNSGDTSHSANTSSHSDGRLWSWRTIIEKQMRIPNFPFPSAGHGKQLKKCKKVVRLASDVPNIIRTDLSFTENHKYQLRSMVLQQLAFNCKAGMLCKTREDARAFLEKHKIEQAVTEGVNRLYSRTTEGIEALDEAVLEAIGKIRASDEDKEAVSVILANCATLLI
ncbi:hypothetical protein MAR_002367 [Mya arenaria]|uniref:Uncharacterized protein n=1 Tax=Mya arenaria TaxID=6604 RepID=A0ABY7FH79_MYAAR|nr:hypothetical protein MAR_002367 [Mya arenaria]